MLSSLDVAAALRRLEELARFVEEERRIADRLREGGFGYLVDGLDLPFPGGSGGSH